MPLNVSGEVSEYTKDILVKSHRQIFRYFTLYFAFILFLLGAGYYLIQSYEAEKLRTATMTAELEHVKQASKSLARDLEIVGSDFHALAESEHLSNYINNNSDAFKAKLTERFKTFLTDRRIYDQARLLDVTGQEVIRVNNNSGTPVVVPENQLQNKANRYYVSDTMGLPKGRLYVSPLDLNIENGKIELPYKPVLRIATPLFAEDGTIQGQLIVNYLANTMLDQFFYLLPNGDQEKSEYSILNQDGYWLHHFNKSKEWGFMFGTGNNFATQYPQIWAKVSSQNSGQIEDEFGVFTFSSVYPSAHVVAGIKKPSHDEKLKSHTQFTNFDQNQSVWKVMSLVEAQRMVPYPFDANNSPLLWVLSGMLVLSTLGSWQMARLSVIRKKNEASLRVLSQAVEQNPSMVLITDKDGGIEYVNLRFCKTTGYEKAEIIGQNPNVLNAQNMTAEDYETMWKDITQGKNWAGDMFDKRKDGSNYWASSHISPIRDAKGEITHFIGMQQDITEEKALREELERMARTDALTGIYNRRHFYELVDTEVQRCRRYKRPLAVMMIDLDFFKQVNDSYGHLAGDICLVSFVNFVSEALRTTDIFARFGGEEFIIALPDTSLDAATNLAERLRERISELDVVFNEQTISISVSVGLSEWGNNEETLQETISRADMALYQAKKNGRNRVEVTNAT